MLPQGLLSSHSLYKVFILFILLFAFLQDKYLNAEKPSIIKKFELDNASDFSEELLRYEFEEKSRSSDNIVQPKAFSKPAKPGRK